MARYKVETDQGTFEVETDESATKPDAFQQAVNYKTGTVLDAPLGLVQGVAKGAASTGVGIGSLFRKAAGLAPLSADTFQADTEAHGAAENIGKFVEQGARISTKCRALWKAS
jgi:hypothetical protein